MEDDTEGAGVLASDKIQSLAPTWQNVEDLELINKVLSLLQSFTDEGEENVTVSYVEPVLHLFNIGILAHQKEDTNLTKSIKTGLPE